jgi:hypothetical protein
MTVGEMLYLMARKLRRMRNGTATGGSTTTLVDSAMNEPDEFFNEGVIFFLSGTLAGKTATITSYDLTTTTFTFATQTAALAAGVRYAVIEPVYNREMLITALNEALADLGAVPQYDSTLTTVLDQEEYTLPTGVHHIKSVQFAGNTAGTFWQDPYRLWKEIDGSLYLDTWYLPTVAGLPIRLKYDAPHAEVSADSDAIADAIHPDLLAWKAVEQAARGRAGLS